MSRRSPSAYTVITPEGVPRRNVMGLVVFTRRLRDAVKQAQSDDYIQGWGSSGQPLTRYAPNGRRWVDLACAEGLHTLCDSRRCNCGCHTDGWGRTP